MLALGANAPADAVEQLGRHLNYIAQSGWPDKH